MIETIRSISDYINDGDWIESKDQSTCGIRLLQTGNIGNTRYLEKASRSKYISEETFERMRCSEIFAGDILISRLPDPVGRACIVPENLGKAITAVDCTIVRVNKEKCLPEYLLYYTDSPVYRHQVNKYLLGATRIRISRKNLETIQVPLPDITDQENIVSNLLKVDALIDKFINSLNLWISSSNPDLSSCLGIRFLIHGDYQKTLCQKWENLVVEFLNIDHQGMILNC